MRSMTLDGFSAFLRTLPAAVKKAEHAGLEKAAVIVETEAKAELGTYQSAVGGLPGWAELADVTKEDRVRLGYTPNDPGLRSGEARGSIKHSVDGAVALIGSNDENLVYFERGTSRQPPRPALAGSAFRKAHEVANVIGSAVAHAIAGKSI